MSLINSETTQLELISKLLMVETATLGHLIDGGLWLPQLQCVLPGKCCGPAVTASLHGDDGYSLPLAIDVAKPGDVLVIERVDDECHAPVGER
jgi:regulator of RNase E activity RraA